MPIDTPEAIRSRVPPRTFDERLALDPRIQIPDRHLDSGLGHVVAADAAQRRVDVARVRRTVWPTTSGAMKPFDDVPHRLGGFAAVVRVGLGDTIRPSLPVCLLERQLERESARRCDRTNGRSSFRRNAPAAAGTGTVQPCQSSFSHCRSSFILLARHAYKLYSAAQWPFHYLAIEGPIGVGKTRLAERLAPKLEATTILEDTENPFLADFYADRPGSALQAQLFYLLNRHRQMTGKRQADLFLQTTIYDYVFDKDKIFAYLNLDDNELFIYQRLFDLLARDVPPPDLVVYLQAPTGVADAAAPQEGKGSRKRDPAARRGIRPRVERSLPATSSSTTPPPHCWWSKPPNSIRNPTTRPSTSSSGRSRT